MMMRWALSWRYDLGGARFADRHYSRQAVGSPQFVAPGRCVVLRTTCGKALWVVLWQRPEYSKHEFPGAWVNTLFRNEGAGLSSELIREAVAATRSEWPDVPPLGIVSLVDASKVRRKRDPGRCYSKAGFRRVALTKKRGLVVFQMLPSDMPSPDMPIGANAPLFV